MIQNVHKKLYPELLYVVFLGILSSIAAASGAFADDYLSYVIKEFASQGDTVIKDQQDRFIVISPDKELAQKIMDRELMLYEKFHGTFKTLTFWDDPAIVKIFPDANAYVTTTQAFGTSAFMAKFRADSRTHRLIASWKQDGLIENLIPHETAHIFITDLARMDEINSTTGNRVLPRWIDEGLAQYFQSADSLRNYKIYIMNMAFRENGVMPFDEFFSATDYPDNTYYFYIQAEVLTHFLLSQPNGDMKVRNYITTFRSKVKDGKRAFDLAFPEYAQPGALQAELVAWSKAKLKNYKPDIQALNAKISKFSEVDTFNQNLYKEVALSLVAYQLYVNENFKGSLRLANEALDQKNGFSIARDVQIRSLFKLKDPSAEVLLEQYKETDRKNAYILLANLKHDQGKYQEEASWLEKLLEIDSEDGFDICLRLAATYGHYLNDSTMAEFYMKKAMLYPRKNMDAL
jgi:hypothetical protein